MKNKTQTEEMRRSWLVQRLQKPRNFDNPFNFGGGLKNGGLSDDAMNLLRGIFSFDYMGAAEFEFGAVPKALQRLAEANLATHSFTIPGSEVYFDAYTKGAPLEVRDRLYVICPKGWEEEIEARLRDWARDGHAEAKEQPRVNSAIHPRRDWDSDLIGWLELDNGWLAFCDREAYEKTCKLFALTPNEA